MREVTKEELANMYYHEGLKLREIGERLGCTKQWVAQLMEKHGLDRREGDPDAPLLIDENPRLKQKLLEYIRKTNLPQKKIAKRLEVDPSTIRRWANELDLDIDWRKRMAEQRKVDLNIEEAKKLYWEEGKTLQEVADTMGCSAATVRKRFKENDIMIRKPGVRPNMYK